MENLREKIRAAIRRSEHQEIEFKSAKGGLPESFWETFSAFANTNGGIIVLGVKEKNGQFYPEGLSDQKITEYKKRFWDCAHNKEKVSAPLLVEKEVREMEIDGHKVLVFEIPRAHFSLRPVYLTPNPIGHTFKRNHEGDFRCTELEIRQMFADSMHVNQPFDNEILPGFTINDIDIPSLNGFRQRFKNRKPEHPWVQYSDMEFLEKIGAYRYNRSTGKEGFTRAGILMFGKTESINDPACAPWYFPDYQEKMAIDPNERWSDRLCPDGTWEANLYQFFYKTYNKISHTLPMPFRLDGITRIEETSAHISLREALVNLCVHSSYAEQGNLVVKRELDKITFRNPGRMLISPEDFYAGGHSECRNPIIQKMFTLLGYGEKAGSGYDYISKGWADNNWPMPQISEHSDPDYVTLEFDAQSLIDTISKELGEQQHIVQEKQQQWVQEKQRQGDQEGSLRDHQRVQEGSLRDHQREQEGDKRNQEGQQQNAQGQQQNAQGQQQNAQGQQQNAQGQQQNAQRQQQNVERQQQILIFCKEPKSLQELLNKFGVTDRGKFKKKYLNPLLGNGLEYTHPENPNHRQQKYVTVKSN